MFEILSSKEKPLDVSPRTRAHIVHAAVVAHVADARHLALVLNETSPVQRNLIRLAACELVRKIDEFERDQEQAVKRVVAAEAARA